MDCTRKHASHRLCLLAGLALVLAGNGSDAAAYCFDQAGSRYGVAPELLRAIAMHESALAPDALHRNRDGTWDQGLMQINSRHRQALLRYGIGPTDLWDPCTNVMTGAWVLAQAIARHGYTWDAVAAYNVGGFTRGNAVQRERYVRAVAGQPARITR